MSRRDKGPPKKEPGPRGEEAGPQRLDITTNRHQSLPETTDSRGADTVCSLRRRSEKGRRLERLPCGCPDPWAHRCRPRPVLTLASAIAAAEHLAAAGLIPIFDPGTERALRLRAWLRRYAA